MKSSVLALALAFTTGIISFAVAGPAPVTGGPGGYSTDPITNPASTGSNGPAVPAPSPPTGPLTSTGSSTGSGPSTGSTSAGQSYTGSDVEEDDTLYRGSTKDGLDNGAMIRDEGPLHFKPRAKEKIQEVDSKNLHSSGTDSKFQGSLLHSSVTSIADVGDKAEKADQADQQPEAKYEGDPRFRTKQLIFTPDKADESKKRETTRTKADSSPSPSPSPTASASAPSR